ncbi:MAG: arsenite methyltransferase [Chloroflexi bacterium]|nr:arsenite methyltransferase [Chloroflexota bacterium]
MLDSEREVIRQAVRDKYGSVAKATDTGCGCSIPSCCSPGDISIALGYSPEQLTAVPEGANMGLGCGNPHALAGLKEGETVLDLGSGGGFDCFLAAQAVGDTGRVIGVDATPEMVSKARQNSASAGFKNIEFRLGEIENLPVADSSIDVIISNCVINLSPDKSRVFRESLRVLKPGGRLAISDIVATAQLPDEMKDDIALYTGCVAGAVSVDELIDMLSEVGFTNIRIQTKDESKEFIHDWAPGMKVEDFVVSAIIEAVKPECCS